MRLLCGIQSRPARPGLTRRPWHKDTKWPFLFLPSNFVCWPFIYFMSLHFFFVSLDRAMRVSPPPAPLLSSLRFIFLYHNNDRISAAWCIPLSAARGQIRASGGNLWGRRHTSHCWRKTRCLVCKNYLIWFKIVTSTCTWRHVDFWQGPFSVITVPVIIACSIEMRWL